VSFATTAGRPHVRDLSVCPAGAVILHISLRDLSPEAILASDNVVDDGDAPARRGDGSIAVFSPFGLGVLDVAVGKLVLDSARATGRGTPVASFLPQAGD
ncbi:MAG TPA: 2,3-diaminopropionate biosynthesis protein SbnB, partial [Thermoanaerobaculia bacterium]|nr:2,3-diaminopropionate biosynthesis protein SbnB [Thermoanaerobaculia bacterium]